jgi:hypothetical protein
LLFPLRCLLLAALCAASCWPPYVPKPKHVPPRQRHKPLAIPAESQAGWGRPSAPPPRAPGRPVPLRRPCLVPGFLAIHTCLAACPQLLPGGASREQRDPGSATAPAPALAESPARPARLGAQLPAPPLPAAAWLAGYPPGLLNRWPIKVRPGV